MRRRFLCASQPWYAWASVRRSSLNGTIVRQTRDFDCMSRSVRRRAAGVLVLAALLAGCRHPDEQMRSRVRGNLHKIEGFLWGEMSRLNAGDREKAPGQSLPAEIGRHAKGAFLTATPPRVSVARHMGPAADVFARVMGPPNRQGHGARVAGDRTLNRQGHGASRSPGSWDPGR